MGKLSAVRIFLSPNSWIFLSLLRVLGGNFHVSAYWIIISRYERASSAVSRICGRIRPRKEEVSALLAWVGIFHQHLARHSRFTAFGFSACIINFLKMNDELNFTVGEGRHERRVRARFTRDIIALLFPEVVLFKNPEQIAQEWS